VLPLAAVPRGVAAPVPPRRAAAPPAQGPPAPAAQPLTAAEPSLEVEPDIVALREPLSPHELTARG
jgi:hypothetical protein